MSPRPRCGWAPTPAPPPASTAEPARPPCRTSSPPAPSASSARPPSPSSAPAALPPQDPAAGAPLSLQVHPDLAQAKEGYADEERRGVPIDAGHRNYKDANHKPELICALTPFDGLCGFRPPLEAAELLAGLGVDSLEPYVDLLRAHPEEAALREVLTAVLTADRADMARTVTEAAAAAERLGGPYKPYASLVHDYPGDPGVIAAMLLNHVRLQPGEAMFLGAGIPHAYLDGLGVELMANSDNVLRCGLTPKHVDVPELLKIVKFEPSDPGVLRPEASPRARRSTRPPSTNSGSPASSWRPAEPPGARGRAPADPALHGRFPAGRRTGPAARRVGLRTGGRKGRTVRKWDDLPSHRGGLT